MFGGGASAGESSRTHRKSRKRRKTTGGGTGLARIVSGVALADDAAPVEAEASASGSGVPQREAVTQRLERIRREQKARWERDHQRTLDKSPTKKEQQPPAPAAVAGSGSAAAKAARTLMSDAKTTTTTTFSGPSVVCLGFASPTK